MKIYFKKTYIILAIVTLSFFFGLIFLFSNRKYVSAEASTTEVLTEYDLGADSEAAIIQGIAKIESELEKMQTDVVTELNEQVLYYENMYKTESDQERRIQINGLIQTTQSLITDYQNFKNNLLRGG